MSSPGDVCSLQRGHNCRFPQRHKNLRGTINTARAHTSSSFIANDKSVNSKGGSRSGGCCGGRVGGHCLPAHPSPFGVRAPLWGWRPSSKPIGEIIFSLFSFQMQQSRLFSPTSEIQFVFLFTILNAFFLYLPCIFCVSQNTEPRVPSWRHKNLPGSSLSQTPEVTLTGETNPAWPASSSPHPACHPQLISECAQKSLRPQLSQTPGDDFFKLVT